MVAIWGGSFLENTHGQFDPLNWLFGAGLGTNLGASVVAFAAGFAAGRLVWVRHIRPHLHLTQEVHHLLHTGEPHPRALARKEGAKS